MNTAYTEKSEATTIITYIATTSKRVSCSALLT